MSTVRPPAAPGYSIELVNPSPIRDNDFGANWALSRERGGTPGVTGKAFLRGDVDLSGAIDISDPIQSLQAQFAGGAQPPCQDAADTDDSGVIDISDPIYSLMYQFAGGNPPPPPFPEPGSDPTPDSLTCEEAS